MEAGDERGLRQRRGGAGERWRDIYATPADHPPVDRPAPCAPLARAAGTTFLDLDLGTDLLLSELRGTWPATDPAAAAIEWRGPGMRFGRESVPVADRALWASAVADARAFTAALAELRPYDRDRWAWAAGRVAGLLAVWSLRVEPEPAQFARASEELSASASRRGGRARPGAVPDLRRAAYLLTQVRADARDAVAERLLLRQLTDATTAIADAHRARGANARADRLHTEVVLALAPRREPGR